MPSWHRNRLVAASCIAVALSASSTWGQTSPGDQVSLGETALRSACAASPQAAPCALVSSSWKVLAGDIHEYTFTLQVGPGAHDTIRVHRVVRESADLVPIHAAKSIFMVHGDVWGFDAAFAGAALTGDLPATQSIAAFLAENDVDVWGIDHRRVLVPLETTDFTFMRSWNVQTNVNDLGLSLTFSRTVRALTGSGFGKMALSGWSRGVFDIVAYASAQTRVPSTLQNVKGLIPIDFAFKYGAANEAERLGACQTFAALKASFDSGISEGGITGPAPGIGLQAIGFLAASDPTAPSPIAPGLDNLQTALLGGSATFLILPPAVRPAPFYHFTAGIFSGGLPVGLKHSDQDYVLRFLQAGAPYQSLAEVVDGFAIQCNELDVPYDDHLRDITLPVLYVGAAGGAGVNGTNTATLFGSQDVSSSFIQLEAEPALDFGHADLFLANDARQVAWLAVLGWLGSH